MQVYLQVCQKPTTQRIHKGIEKYRFATFSNMFHFLFGNILLLWDEQNNEISQDRMNELPLIFLFISLAFGTVVGRMQDKPWHCCSCDSLDTGDR